MNKKGSIEDKIYLLYLVAGAVILIAVFGFAWSITQPILKDLGNDRTVELMDQLDPAAVNSWFDLLIVFFYFGINILICVVLPLKVENNAAMFGVIFILMFFFILIWAVYANALIEFMQDLQPTYNYTIFLLSNFVLIEVIFTLIMMVALYFNSQKSAEYIY